MRSLYCLLYIFVFMAFGVLSPLIGQYLHGIGFTGEQIGIVTAAGTCTTVFAAPFWGHRYSVLHSRSGRFLLVAAIFLCAALTSLVLSQVMGFAVFLLFFVLLSFFQSPSSSLLDTLTIDEGQRFGPIRTFGAIGFAAACFGAASAADRWGTGLIFPVYTGCFLAAICVILLIWNRQYSAQLTKDPADPRKKKTDGDQPTVTGNAPRHLRDMGMQLASNRSYVFLVICAFFINGTDNANNTYFSFLYLEGGGSLAGVGIAFLLMAGSEAPFMAASDRLCERFGQGRILLVAMVFSVVRFALFALGLPAPSLIALFPLQGLVNGLTLVEFVKFVARVVPTELHGLGIAVYYALGSSLSTIVCQLIGGRLLDHGLFQMSGPQSVYLFFAVFNVAGVVIFLASRLYRQ